MASKSRKTNRRKASGFDVAQAEHETYSVDALPTETNEKDLRALLKPARSLAGDAKHYEKLDGAMDAAFAGGIVPKVEWSAISSFVSFVGYGVLQQLSQDALIRLCIQTRTDEMLRSWIDIKCDDEERKKKLESEIARIGLRETPFEGTHNDGVDGRRLFVHRYRERKTCRCTKQNAKEHRVQERHRLPSDRPDIYDATGIQCLGAVEG